MPEAALKKGPATRSPDKKPVGPGPGGPAEVAAITGGADVAALLGDPRLQHSSGSLQRQQLLSRLQRGYGNGHVAQVVARLQVQRDVACAPAPERPAVAPAQDPRFKQVEVQVHQVAAKERAHPPARAEAGQAQAAAQPPSNDVSSQAAAAQVGEMDRQKPGTFDKKAFVEAVRKAVEAAAPKNLEEADDFKQSGKVGQVKGQVSGQVSKGKEESQQDIKQKTAAAPDTSKATPKPVSPLKEEKPGKPPAAVPAAKAMPDPKSPAETSLAHGPCQVNEQMAEAHVTEGQLKKSNEPEFNAAVDAKKEVEANARQAPQQYRAGEKAALQQARTEVGEAAAKTAGAVHQQRAGALGHVGADKGAAKRKDEQERATVSAKIEGIFGKTKTETLAILDALDGKVDKAFEDGEKSARDSFENYVDSRMRAYKHRRYGGLDGGLLWAKDKLLGMPDEVNAFYQEGRTLYLQKMDAVIGNIADVVGAELGKAKARIAQGKQEIQDYVTGLPKHLQQVGKDAQQEIGSRFEELEQQVDAKQEALVETVAQKYVEARDALDSRIQEMKAENQGLVDKAVQAVKGVVDTILKLKDMLLGVLRKAADVIDKIIEDPIGFLGNLVAAIKQGLDRFVGNIGKHLKDGLMGWLFGTLAEAGIQMPETFDLKGILGLVLQLLGLSYANIRARAVKIVGEKIVARIEQAVEVFKVLVTEGPAGLWKFIQDKLASLKDQVMEQIQDFLITKVITAGITWLISLLNPASAFIKACKMIVDVVMFFIERGSQIMELVNAILDSLGAIASGAIGGAAAMVEGALAKALPVAISFLASLLGLGGIAGKIRSVIEKIQKPVNTLIDKLIGGVLKGFKKLGLDKVVGKVKAGAAWVKNKAKAAKEWGKKKLTQAKDWAKGKAKSVFGPKDKQQDKAAKQPDARTPEQKLADLNKGLDEADKLAGDDKLTPEQIARHLPAIKARYGMTQLEVKVDGHSGGKETLHVAGAVNPTGTRPAHSRDVFDKARAEARVVEGVEEPTQWEAMQTEAAAGAAAGEATPKTRLSPSSASFSRAQLMSYISMCAGKVPPDRITEAQEAVAAGMAEAAAATNSDDIFAIMQRTQATVNTLLKDAGVTVSIKGKKKGKKGGTKPLGLQTHHVQEQRHHYSTNPKTTAQRIRISKGEKKLIEDWAARLEAEYKGHLTASELEAFITEKVREITALVKQRLLEAKLEERGQHIGDDALDEIDLEVAAAGLHSATHRRRDQEDRADFTPTFGQPES